MNGDQSYPAILIVSRPATEKTPAPFVLEDDRVVNSQAEAAQRIAIYRKSERANRCPANLYTYTVTPVDQVTETKARLLAELTPAAPLDWAAAVDQAAELAREHYRETGDGPSLDRLPRAVEIAKARNWQKMGDAGDTWAMASQSGPATYLTNGRCNCPDFEKHGAGWLCKHRIGRLLARKAAGLLAQEPATE